MKSAGSSHSNAVMNSWSSIPNEYVVWLWIVGELRAPTRCARPSRAGAPRAAGRTTAAASRTGRRRGTARCAARRVPWRRARVLRGLRRREVRVRRLEPARERRPVQRRAELAEVLVALGDLPEEEVGLGPDAGRRVGAQRVQRSAQSSTTSAKASLPAARSSTGAAARPDRPGRTCTRRTGPHRSPRSAASGARPSRPEWYAWASAGDAARCADDEDAVLHSGERRRVHRRRGRLHSDWLFEVPRNGGSGAEGFGAFFAGVGAMAMGATTYEWVFSHERLDEHPEKWREWYGAIPTWVFTHRRYPARRGRGIPVRGGRRRARARRDGRRGGRPQRVARRRRRARRRLRRSRAPRRDPPRRPSRCSSARGRRCFPGALTSRRIRLESARADGRRVERVYSVGAP